jgi:DNA invertase Pin-like site-specific DNA recombinase
MKRKNITALYCRTAQESSYGIEAQMEILSRYANEQGYEELAVYTDNGYSGLSLDRPGFAQMQSDIDEGIIKTVIVRNVDRISRDKVVLFDWINDRLGDVHLISVLDGCDNKSVHLENNLKQLWLYFSK